MREKLIDIVEYYADFLDWDRKEAIVDGIIATFAKDNNVTSKWIPVTEKLPEQSGKYIVCSERKIKVGNWERMEKNVYQAKYYVYPTGCHWGQRDKGKHITHWMPMPEVPKGE